MSTTELPYFRFAGSHHDIGAAHGAACEALIRRHLDLSLAKLDRGGIDRADALAVAMEYRPFVVDHAPALDEEIRGMAAGAGLDVGEAYLLQLRAEVHAEILGRVDAANECTTFAVLPEASADGIGLAGQNADLPERYAPLMIVMHLVPDDGPEILMATPAGQISYIGVSSDGMASFGNFLDCRGWTRGFPRYLLSRFALQLRSVDAAVEGLRALPRASSRNLLMLDGAGAADFENTPTHDAVLGPTDGLLAHSNHYLAPELAEFECAKPENLANSRRRYERMTELLRAARGRLSPTVMAEILRDRAAAADALSVEPGDKQYQDASGTESMMTVVSVIASPAEGRIWVCGGPPSRGVYSEYTFDGGCTGGQPL